MRRVNQSNRREKGNSILEFALIAIPTVFLMLGVVVIGVDLGRSVQVAQISRDAGSMFVRGVPLYQTGAQGVVARLGQSMNLQTTGGDGLVILSKIIFIPDASCGTPADASYANCTVGKNKLVQRITFGDTTLPGTHFPTAGPVALDSQGQVANYLIDDNADIDNFGTVLQLKPNEISYVAETYFRTPVVDMPGFQKNNPGVYAQSFF